MGAREPGANSVEAGHKLCNLAYPKGAEELFAYIQMIKTV